MTFDSSISGAAIERALMIARSPAVEGTRFHRPYIIEANGPFIDSIGVNTIEMITEFRRMELIGEEHAGLNDTFGRAGIGDGEAALKPWRNRVAIVAHLRFAFPV